MQHIDATEARKLYPSVKGPIFGADLWSGFAILDMGVGAHGVMVEGKFAACCPDYSSAKAFGEMAADLAIIERGPKIPKTVLAFAVKHKISLGAVHSRDGSHIEYYYIADATMQRAEMTRSDRPTAKQALAMCRRYLQRIVA